MPDPTFARGGTRRASVGRPVALSVSVVDERGRRVAVPGLAAWLRRSAPSRARGQVTVALVSDRKVRALNREYRRKDYATDVLSFPAFAREAPSLQPPALSAKPFLGDIVIARGVAKRQARDARHSERIELKVLALHGLLPLLGYDHETDEGQMRRVEQ